MDKEEIVKLLETEYISKIYGFSYLKTNTKEEAEDLSQEIILQILKSIYAGKVIENLNAFIWRVANNIFFKWLRSKTHNNTTYLTEFIPSRSDIEVEYLLKEEQVRLRNEIALLSKKYRDNY